MIIKKVVSPLSWLAALMLIAFNISASNLPEQFKNVAKDNVYYHLLSQPQDGAIGLYRKSKDSLSTLVLPLEGELLTISVNKVRSVGNSYRFVSQTFSHSMQDYQVFYTQGTNSGIGEIIGDGKHLLFEVRGNEIWQVDVRQLNLLPGLYEEDTLGIAPMHLQSEATSTGSEYQNITVVDVMLLFTPNILAKYPGEMSFTLMNHLVEKANQSFVDSDVNVQLRLVRSELVNYTKPSSSVALNDIVAALDNDPGTITDSSLTSIASWRNQSGADIVAMIRTHDLNEREVCGRALFPDTVPGVLANVSNVGISGGSNCINTFTHEIGHNFGAGHQWRDGQSVGQFGFSGALLLPGKYSTVMSSIGTGDENRNYKLPYFSNVTLACGDRVCGDSQFADNARTINLIAAQNAALRESVFTDEVVVPIRSVTDTDGDGVNDREDAFPFFPEETLDSDGDGVGDNLDVFPNDPNETLDTDGDGIGNNQDPDDDNDGVSDSSDQLPLDPNETLDTDSDGVGNNQDQLPNNFQEVSDSDQDGVGDLSDLDDDNDGVEDFYPPSDIEQTNLLVVSANSSEILQYDAVSGDFLGVVTSVTEGGFTFRSDIVTNSRQQVYFIAFSDVYQLDRQTGAVKNYIDRSELGTNFPAHLLFLGDQHLLVGNGLGVSYLDGFSIANAGTTLAKQTFDIAVWRDVLQRNANELLVASRSTNELVIVADNAGASAGNVFANDGLSKPEHLAVDASGRIYVSNAGTMNVSQYSSSGVYLGEFISAGSGGLGLPECMVIGPDGDFYLCSDTNQVLKFDGTTGAFDSVVVDAGVGGLDRPVGLVFVGKALDSLPYSGEHDSDGDGINNSEDDLPLDPTSSVDTDGDGIGNETDDDDDGDGMPDSYEEEFGLDPLDPADATLDTDGDGVSNLEEYNQNTDPTVADNTPAPVSPPASSNSGGGGAIGLFGLFCVCLAVRRKRFVNRH